MRRRAPGVGSPGRAGDGVVFVGLQAVRGPALVVDQIAGALRLRAGDDQDLLRALKAYLRPREFLMVLDNFEQVLEAAPLLSELLEAAPQLKMLVTSHAVLRLSAERSVALPPLPVPRTRAGGGGDAGELVRLARDNPSVQLFVWRARALMAELAIDEGASGLLLDIVRRLDGWPLAIVLAASRIGNLSLERLRDRLQRWLDVLTGGSRDMPDRQKTLRRTIEWSLEFLSPNARLLQRPSLFVGGATLEAVERLHELCGDPGEAEPVDVLAELVDHSLVERRDTSGGARFTMLEIVREAALEALLASDEREAVERAHAQVFVELA